MATLVTRLTDLTTRIATEVKALRTLVNGNAADLSSLATDTKTHLVAAINELHQDILDVEAEAGAQIDDTAGAGDTDVTFSADKLLDLLLQLKNDILGGAGSAYDTLQEIKSYIDSGDGSIVTALGKRVAVDQAQSFTTGEKSQARSNIGALSTDEIGQPDTNFVTVFNNGLV